MVVTSGILQACYEPSQKIDAWVAWPFIANLFNKEKLLIIPSIAFLDAVSPLPALRLGSFVLGGPTSK